MTSTQSSAQNSEQNNTQNNAQNAYANQTIQTLLNRRSIRAFKDEPISEDVAKTLEAAAQRAACSQFLNDWSAIKITSKDLKQKLSQLGNQTYIATAPLLYVFIIDQHRNAAIARKTALMQTETILLLKQATDSRNRKTTPFLHCTQWKQPQNRLDSVA